MHTPAPWILDDLGDKWDLITETKNPHGPSWIAEIISGYDGDEANAKLIAAAPELLEACKAMAEYISGQWEKDWPNRPNHLRLAENAIKKAEGKP